MALVLFAAESVLREGRGLLHAVQRLRPGLPVLVTGELSDLAAIADPGGPVSTLRRPFTAAELARVLRSAITASPQRGGRA